MKIKVLIIGLIVFSSLLVFTEALATDPEVLQGYPNFRETSNNSGGGLNLIDRLGDLNISNSGGSSGGSSGGKDFKGIVGIIISSIFNPLVLLFLGLAVLYFMWGVLKYVRRGESDSDAAEGAKMMAYGIFAIFVMISVWGLVTILVNTFGLETSALPPPALK